MSLTEQIIDVARAAGASAVGVTGVEPFADARSSLVAAKEAGRSGPLGFTYDEPERATDVASSLPWARSLVVFGVSYTDRASRPGKTGPVIGRFATADHYRPVRSVAGRVASHIEGLGARTETLIDDNRLVDRAAAARAGIVWLGRSTMALAPGHGPWMLLGSVATDLILSPTDPMRRDCGTCTACIPACPTGAIADGELDARRCLSTWLQTAGSIPMWIRPLLGRRIYGCDDCLTSCPPGHPSLRAATPTTTAFSFTGLLDRDDDALVDEFGWWFIPRRDGRFIRRNLLVAAGNSGEADVFDAIVGHLGHRSSLIRGHAAWAVARSARTGSAEIIGDALEAETAPEAREEMLLALLMLENPETYQELLALDELVGTDQRYEALALLGVDLHDNGIGDRPVDMLLVEKDTRPDFAPHRMPAMIRVNDRHRVLEEIRRQG